jgi:adenosylhomocysteine nucleosidase
MTNSSATLVCFAVREEAAHFRKFARSRPDIEILLTGMGRRNAEKAIGEALAKQRPQGVITAGFAGGLDPGLARGTVVFCAEQETNLMPALLSAGARIARFYCAEAVVATVAQKRVLRDNTGAQVVEMESQFIQAVCREHEVPVATVRVILDTATEDLALDFNRLMTPDQRIDGRKLAIALLKSPQKIPALLRLQKQSAMAAKALGEVLARALVVEGVGEWSDGVVE